MPLHSAFFLFFCFPLSYVLYGLIPHTQWKNRFLIAVSLLFYAFGQWQGIPVLLLSAALSYLAPLLMQRGKNGKYRKALLILSVTLHLLLLCSLKYLGFLVQTLNNIFSVQLPVPHFFQPIGISFFTFKAISCTIDAYRQKNPAPRRFEDVLLYISFFPQVTSGPISRFDAFSACLQDRPFNPRQAAFGLRKFIVGFSKKLLIAGLITSIADRAFSLGSGLDFRMAWLGAAAYSLQLYFDFSGYSDMATGLGEMFGFSTPPNFQYPYIACSITDFWRRWHISLSTWFRDYLYIPLGGNRKGTLRQCRNKAIVFLLCGLWHGANWTFLLWGLWHGLFSVLETSGAIPISKLRKSRSGRAVSHIYALLAICLGFVIFRAADGAEALGMFRAMFSGFSLLPASTLALELITPAEWGALFVGMAGSLPIAPYLRTKMQTRGESYRKIMTLLSFLGSAVLFVICLLAMAGSGFQPFIYAQF